MPSKLPRFLFCLSKHLSSSAETNVSYNLSSHSVCRTHLSSIPDRPLRGERPLRGDRRGHPSGKISSKEFNGDYLGKDSRPDARQNSINSSANRPLRGERRFNRSEGLCSLDGDGAVEGSGRTRGLSQDFPLRGITKPVERERPGGLFGNLDLDNNDKEIMGSNRMDIRGHSLDRNLSRGEGRKEDDQYEDLFGLGNGKNDDQKAAKTLPKDATQVTETEASSSNQAPPDVDEIFKKMKETGLIPNAVAMLDGLCKDGLVQEAMKLFGLMREKGTIPEVVIYTAVVEGFLKAQKFEDAKRVFRKMQNNGISPNAFSYTVLIRGFLTGKELEDATAFCIEMLEAGHVPNVATFVGLVDGFCREKGSGEAQGIIQRLRDKGYAVDDKSVREYLGKKGPFSPSIWEVILGKRSPPRIF